jgi:hypothetical protein
MKTFACPKCHVILKGDEAGGVTTCASCGKRVRVPPSSPTPPPMAILAEPVDEDESAIMAGLAANYPAEATALGRPRFRVESQILPEGAFKPVFAAVLTCIPNIFCLANPSLVLLFLIGVVWVGSMIGFSVWFVRWQLRKTKIRAVVYPAGFVLYDGYRYSVWRWSDVDRVNMEHIEFREFTLFIQTNRFKTKFYRLRNRAGDEYSFWSTWGPRAAQFGRIVEKETYDLMAPAAQARLQAGETVEFAPFRMQQHGLTYRDHFTPWADAGPASIKQGRLQIERVGPNGGAARVFLKAIDNHHVFLPLLDQKLKLDLGN